MLKQGRESTLSFNPEEYSTSLFLGADAPAQLLAPGTGVAPDRLALRLEVMAASVARGFAHRGMDLVDDGDAIAASSQAISAATSLICLVPPLAKAVDSLVRSVHILRSTDPNIDVSFSDPAIPFSIFLSVPKGIDADVRIAEAIVHEAMHLQLSLVEQAVPLVIDSGITRYSPWKQAQRPLSGVIHALYVFRVIDQWLARISSSTFGTPFVDRRRTQIAAEIEELDLTGCDSGFTSDGHGLLTRLLRTTDSSPQTC